MQISNYDWLLTGSHPLSQVACAYFPGVRVDSAARTFRKQVKLYPKLLEELCNAGYHDHLTMMLPVHIAAVIQAWGMPNAAHLK